MGLRVLSSKNYMKKMTVSINKKGELVFPDFVVDSLGIMNNWVVFYYDEGAHDPLIVCFMRSNVDSAAFLLHKSGNCCYLATELLFDDIGLYDYKNETVSFRLERCVNGRLCNVYAFRLIKVNNTKTNDKRNKFKV